MQYRKIKLEFGKQEYKTSKNSKVQLQLMKFHKLRLSTYVCEKNLWLQINRSVFVKCQIEIRKPFKLCELCYS
ncbi:unnamed protein product [Paramecium pentaurelia]|uniref:Uncharacterized protein n=1 Tax=Paramecium pentaurelia TaxID=43138 RepID=A0A8S1VJ18_9CILI|nr:unnamed protein product [Paramecium pentaurelia]